MSPHRQARLLTAFILSTWATTVAHAQAPTNTWAAAATGVWSNGGNWLGNSVPTGATATTASYIAFSVSGAAAVTSTYDLAIDPFPLNGFLFDSQLAGGLTVAGTSTFAFIRDPASNNPVINQNGSGLVVIAAPVRFDAPVTFGGTGAGPVTLTGDVSGSGPITINRAAGTTVFSGLRNTNVAGLTVQAGTLQVELNASRAALGTSNDAYQMDQTSSVGATVARVNSFGRVSGGETVAPITLGSGAVGGRCRGRRRGRGGQRRRWACAR